jgi:hypothetical protein
MRNALGEILVACLSALPSLLIGQAPTPPVPTAVIASRGMPSTMTLVTYDSSGTGVSQGSAFAVRRGVVATNWHVVRGAVRARVQLTPGGEFVEAAFLAADSVRDVALLAVPQALAPPVTFGPPPSVGERVVAIGSPLGLSQTVTEGIVSASRDLGTRRLIQISAALSHGSSGGPVFDGAGRVFGIATAGIEEGQGLNFATPVSYAVDLLSDSLLPRPFPSPPPSGTQQTRGAECRPAAPGTPGEAGTDFAFLGVGWDASQDSVRRGYIAQCLAFHHASSDGDLTFTGSLFDHNVAVIAQFADSGLARVRVIFDVPPGSERGLYESLLDALSAKYGSPPNLYTGWFLQGMNQAGAYRSTWPKRRPGQPKPKRENIDSFERLDLISLRAQGVRLEYVSATWEREAERRTRAKASAF